jgi:hypothetical protein
MSSITRTLTSSFFQIAPDYFAAAVSYTRKTFMQSAPDGTVHRHGRNVGGLRQKVFDHFFVRLSVSRLLQTFKNKDGEVIAITPRPNIMSLFTAVI